MDEKKRNKQNSLFFLSVLPSSLAGLTVEWTDTIYISKGCMMWRCLYVIAIFAVNTWFCLAKTFFLSLSLARRSVAFSCHRCRCCYFCRVLPYFASHSYIYHCVQRGFSTRRALGFHNFQIVDVMVENYK